MRPPEVASNRDEVAGREGASGEDGAADREVASGRVMGWLRRLGELRQPPPRWRGALLLVAAAVFVGGAVLSWRSLDLDPGEVVWWPVVVVGLVLVPATVAVNVAELVALGRAASVRIGAREGIRVVLVATAANFLPIPGAAAVRVQAFTARGASLGAATAVNVLGALAWVSVALVVAGLAGLALAPIGAVLFLVGGLVGVGVTWSLLVRWRGASPRAAAAVFAAELATVIGHALRLGLVLVALRASASAAQVLVLGANGPLAAAAGIFPSGLGLAEAIGAALAELVALAPAAGFAATALNRVLGVAVTAPLALAFGVGELRGGAPDAARSPHAAGDGPED